ncbi:hypothetical protein AQUCO_00600418v1 [Aquilegia coerulea]|uniref:Uncharacterized protein n=1 Tax=Aquilegia coerulea TaxID=218851 RepID=A0A2G5EPH5_AQUCA|nr:hypothetical protein AQUCO_00600418v1 [Aquilegia coerulea]
MVPNKMLTGLHPQLSHLLILLSFAPVTYHLLQILKSTLYINKHSNLHPFQHINKRQINNRTVSNHHRHTSIA